MVKTVVSVSVSVGVLISQTRDEFAYFAVKRNCLVLIFIF
jgi:hypothetical protein